MKYVEIEKDLFKMDSSYAFAHCISRDCKMGAGIAKEFRSRYPEMPKAISSQRPTIEDTKVYEGRDGRVIFNLITKELYWHKPTYKAFEQTIRSWKEEVNSRGIKKLAIPLLGAGLDKLDWEVNKAVIEKEFGQTDVEIVVCIHTPRRRKW